MIYYDILLSLKQSSEDYVSTDANLFFINFSVTYVMCINQNVQIIYTGWLRLLSRCPYPFQKTCNKTFTPRQKCKVRIPFLTGPYLIFLSQKQAFRCNYNNSTDFIVWLDNHPSSKKAIEDAIKEMHRISCVRFQPRTNEQYYIRFIRSTGQVVIKCLINIYELQTSVSQFVTFRFFHDVK